MDVSIIIVNYNTKDLLLNCIQSIYDNTKDISFEIIVVDNASIDNSKQFVLNKFPFIKWIDSGTNLGFGKANNLGVNHANGEFLFLLNSDTILLNNAIFNFYNYMQSYEDNYKIGALGCFLCDKKGNFSMSSGSFPSIKNEIKYLLTKFKRNRYNRPNKEEDVDFITGADIFIRKELFEKLNGFDPTFFMYYEETDLQFRISKLNLKRRLIAEPQIIHLEGGSFKNNNLSFNRFCMSQKSYNYYIRKHLHGWRFFSYRFLLAFIRLTIFFTTDWSIKEKISAYKIVLQGNY